MDPDSIATLVLLHSAQLSQKLTNNTSALTQTITHMQWNSQPSNLQLTLLSLPRKYISNASYTWTANLQ